MKKNFNLLIGLILLICSCGSDEHVNEPFTNVDPIIGEWEEVLGGSGQYNSIVWTFTADGIMILNFDGTSLASGEWSVLNSPPYTYSFFFDTDQ